MSDGGRSGTRCAERTGPGIMAPPSSLSSHFSGLGLHLHLSTWGKMLPALLQLKPWDRPELDNREPHHGLAYSRAGEMEL